MIIMEDVEENDFKSYLEEISKDFTEDVMQMEADEYFCLKQKQ